ncbi:MAG: HAD-IIIA family hydrolase [Planctomycetes bacterium]|nr:HAD-IIIA family hydrolase [Planctomycetota bacterium]
MRIVHISDLHWRENLPGSATVTCRLSRRVPELFATAIERIRALAPDLLVVSGDLLDYPAYGADYSDLLRQGKADLLAIKKLLDGVACPKAVVPGNHDHLHLSGMVFGEYACDFACAGHRIVSFQDWEGEGHFPRRLGAQRERFDAVLKDGDATPQIHVQHYLTWPEENKGYPHSYRECQSMQRALTECGKVRLVLSGHFHRGVRPAREAGVWYATVPAFCEPPHPFWMYEISGDEVKQEEFTLVPAERPRQPVVFLDRDGVINPQPSYRWGPEPFELLPGVAQAMARLKKLGFALVVVTNQSCVGQGYVTVDTVASVHDKMAQLLRDEGGVELDGVYACYHSHRGVVPEFTGAHPDAKPNPGMLLRAAKELHLDLVNAYLVGDADTDLQAGRNAGTRTVLVRTGHGAKMEAQLVPGLADAVVDDLSAAAGWIEEQVARNER